MAEQISVTICDFGWGSLGKVALVLQQLPPMRVELVGDHSVHHAAITRLDPRHHYQIEPEASGSVALVVNDPSATEALGHLPLVYVDSLPYLWALADEVPQREHVTHYCAQRYPSDRLPLAAPLKERDIHWIDPIVPRSGHRSGGAGVVVNVGGLHSHLSGQTHKAYLALVVWPLLEELILAGRRIAGLCGNLDEADTAQARSLLDENVVVGGLPPKEFQRLLQRADLLITAPGSTTILQASQLRLPTLLLPPQNLSQILNAALYSDPNAQLARWPREVLDLERVQALRPDGEDVALSYIYTAISDAASQHAQQAAVRSVLAGLLDQLDGSGQLDPALVSLGQDGAQQVARLLRQLLLAPPH